MTYCFIFYFYFFFAQIMRYVIPKEHSVQPKICSNFRASSTIYAKENLYSWYSYGCTDESVELFG